MGARALAASPDVRAATVFVVDDEDGVRRSVSRLVRSEGMQSQSFNSPTEFLKCDLPAGPACVVLDMYLDPMTGLEVQAVVRSRPRPLPVVFLSGRSTVSDVAAGFKAGARDFLEKPVKPDELLGAIRRALRRDAADRADAAVLDELRRRHALLTAREAEVMTLLVGGMLNKQVAAELGIAEKTVKVHRARVMEKMGVVAFATLVGMAQRLGLTGDSASG